MSYNYCTFFDKNYIIYGLVLLESIIENSTDSEIYVLALDEECENLLMNIGDLRIHVIALNDFLDSRLSEIKSLRSWKSFCWTCQGALPEYLMREKKISNVIYMDADIKLYRSANYLVDWLVNSHMSVAISPHNFPQNIFRDSLERSCGKYCSGFIVFLNDEVGYSIAKGWRESCIKECTDKPQVGTFGDQIYLERWVREYDGVIPVDDMAVGIAPWNISCYRLYKKQVIFKPSNEVVKPLFYHFHGAKFFNMRQVDINVYTRSWIIDDDLIDFFYRPYLNQINKNKVRFDILINKNREMSIKESVSIIHKIKKWMNDGILYMIHAKILFYIRKQKDIITVDE